MKKYDAMDIHNDYFGEYGGAFVPDMLVKPLSELKEAFIEAMNDKSFLDELAYLQKTLVGRPTPLYFAENLTKTLGGAKIWFKCEGLAHTGAHKINNAIGQCLLAKRMGRTRVIAETGAGQHGVATAAAAAKLGLSCSVYMGAGDIKRQRPNVFNMEMFGAEVIAVTQGSGGLADAIDIALLDFAKNYKDTHYLLGSAVGPAPYPNMVRQFQSIVGKEVKQQALDERLDIEAVIACVGGGSNAIGIFSPFLNDEKPRLIGVEAGGIGNSAGEHATRLSDFANAKTGVVHGFKSKFLLDEKNELFDTHSISAGLDYPGVGPQFVHLFEEGRVEFSSATDENALGALKMAAKHEGILFALESSHALAECIKIAPQVSKDKSIIVNMSGRGDKDIFITAKKITHDSWKDFLHQEGQCS